MLLIVIFALAGIGIIVSGYRGRSVACDPVCAKCGYDLRGYAVLTRCSECGSDLNTPAAVRRKTFRISRGKMVAGLILIAFPWLAIGLPALVDLAEQRLPSNHRLISRIDSKDNYMPSVWSELARRLVSGRLSKPEATTAVDQLIALIKHQGAEEECGARPFYLAADRAGVITAPQYLAIAQAYYGKTPKVWFQSPIPSDEQSFFRIDWGDGWEELPGEHRVFTVKEISMSGPSARPQDITGRPGQGAMLPPDINLLNNRYFILAPAVPVGGYKVKFVVQCNLLAGGSGMLPVLQTTAPPASPPLAQWTETITMPMDVTSPRRTEAAPYELIIRTDSAADPQSGNALALNSADAWCYSDTTIVTFKVKINHIPIGCWFDGKITVGGREHSTGLLSIAADRPSWNDALSCESQPLSEEVRTADLELTPDVASAKNARIEQIWGKAVSFRNVPLHRHELGFSLAQWRKEQNERDLIAASKRPSTTLPSPATAPAR